MKLSCKVTQPIERLKILNCLEEGSSEDTPEASPQQVFL